jgi:lactoylglutathione lyase
MDAIRIEHVAIWVRDLERMCHFYVAMLGAKSGAPYDNPRNGFRSIFVSFGDGARVELMSQPGQSQGQSAQSRFGYAHLALSLGTRAAVDATIACLESHGVTVLSRPRVTGDGYYEAVLADPEGNRIELVA